MFQYLFLLKYWIIFELLNWFKYLLVYIKIITPRYLEIKKYDSIKIIERLDYLSKYELECVLSGCIVYDKCLHTTIDTTELDISDLSNIEINNLIGYSLFAMDDYESNQKQQNIIKFVIKKIEKILGYKFQNNNNNRYLYRRWGNNFIEFSFRPLFIDMTFKLTALMIHIFLIFYKKLKYENINKIGFFYSNFDENKKTLFFIHGFGFGFVPYLHTLLKLNKKYNLIFIVLPNISSYNYYNNLEYINYSIKDTIYNFIKNKKQKDIILLSHSFGTYITEILRRDSRINIFSKIIMVDPIIFWIGCFKMAIKMDFPIVRNNNYKNYLFDTILNFLIYKCLYMKYTCYRIMFGPDFWIYDPADLENKNNISLVLEKGDHIIPAELLYNKTKNHIKCHYFDNDDIIHGSVLMESKYYNDLLNIIE
jgi:pimeloyl-ACP methyl ester carboxylesterase